MQRPPINVPFFYGWVIVGTCFVSATLSGATSALFMSAMVIPMSRELGWTRTEASVALTLGVLMTAGLSPVFGRLADRFGPRLLMPVCAIIVAAGFFGLATAHSLWHYYLSYTIGRGVSQASLSGVVANTAVANWFRQYRGRAMGLYGTAFSLSNTFMVPLAQLMMSVTSWRAVFVMLGIGTLVLVVGPSSWLLRKRPEDVGLTPDGRSVAAAVVGPARSGSHVEHDFTVAEALRTRTFWFLVVGSFLVVLISGSAAFHLFQHYLDVGVSTTMIALSIGCYSLSNGLSTGLWGYLAERVSERSLGIISALVGALLIVAVIANRHELGAVILAATYGFAVRGEGAVFNLIIARYYGRGSYGAISGTLLPIGYIGLGIGPLLGSLVRDAAGDYYWFLASLVFFHVLGAFFLFLARAPDLPPRLRAIASMESPRSGALDRA